MHKVLILATSLTALFSCTTPPVENIVIVQPAPRTNHLRTPEKVKTYTSGKYVDRADQLNGPHQVHRIVQSPRWDLRYTPRNAMSLSPGSVRIAAPVSANPQNYRNRLTQLEKESQEQGQSLGKLAARDTANAGRELDELRTELKDVQQKVLTLDKIDPEMQALKDKVAFLEKKLADKPAVMGNVWVPINDK